MQLISHLQGMLVVQFLACNLQFSSYAPYKASALSTDTIQPLDLGACVSKNRINATSYIFLTNGNLFYVLLLIFRSTTTLSSVVSHCVCRNITKITDDYELSTVQPHDVMALVNGCNAIMSLTFFFFPKLLQLYSKIAKLN